MTVMKKYAAVLAIAAGCLLALIFYSLNVPNNREANLLERGMLTLFSPLMRPVSAMTQGVNRIWTDYLNLVDVRSDNRRLVQQIQEMNSRIIQGNEALLAHDRMKALLDMKKTVTEPTVSATIIGEDGSPWFSTMTIDRGASSGIREGMPVVAAGGVVGQIVKVAPSTSRVVLLTDHASGIAAMIQRSRARGVVKGKGNGLCVMEFSMRDDDVKIGDMVLSSGIGGIFPKGLPIGEVSMVKRAEYGMFQTITIRPYVRLLRLEEVLVLLRTAHE